MLSKDYAKPHPPQALGKCRDDSGHRLERQVGLNFTPSSENRRVERETPQTAT